MRAKPRSSPRERWWSVPMRRSYRKSSACLDPGIPDLPAPDLPAVVEGRWHRTESDRLRAQGTGDLARRCVSASPRSASWAGQAGARAGGQCLVHRQAPRRRNARGHRGHLYGAGTFAFPPARQATCRWTAPARTGKSPASTMRSTCSPKPSTTIRSPSSRGEDANERTCSPTFMPGAPTVHRPPTTRSRPDHRSPTALTRTSLYRPNSPRRALP
jgi:hypothetical protein